MQILLAAALAGLLATPHCAAMCGGFASACGRGRASRGGGLRVLGSARGLGAWHAGRLTTYATLGAVAGAAGAVLPGPAWLPALLSGVLLFWFAAALAGIVRQPKPSLPGFARAGGALLGRDGLGARLAFGALNGLLPCGMVYAALSLAVASGGPLTGALAMLAFGAATVPGLSVLAVGVQRFAARGLWARRSLAIGVLVLGLWSVGTRGFAVGPQHGRAAPAAAHGH